MIIQGTFGSAELGLGTGATADYPSISAGQSILGTSTANQQRIASSRQPVGQSHQISVAVCYQQLNTALGS